MFKSMLLIRRFVDPSLPVIRVHTSGPRLDYVTNYHDLIEDGWICKIRREQTKRKGESKYSTPFDYCKSTSAISYVEYKRQYNVTVRTSEYFGYKYKRVHVILIICSFSLAS